MTPNCQLLEIDYKNSSPPAFRVASLPTWCRHTVICLGLAMGMLWADGQGATTPAAAAPEPYTFTNAAGKTIQAQIIAVVGESVSLKRDDGQSFTVAIKTFVDDDQAYIWHWAVMDAAKRGNPIFKFELTKLPETRSDKTFPGSRRVIPNLAGYKVKVTNTTSLRMLKPIMEYIVFANTNTMVPDSPLAHYYGKFAPDEIKANDQSAFETVKAMLIVGDKQDNGRLEGLWVRVYDADHQLIQEWCSTPELMKKEKWTYDIERSKRGAGTGSGVKTTNPPADGGAPAGPVAGSSGGISAN